MNTLNRAVGVDSDRRRRLRTLLVAVGSFVLSAAFFAVVPRFDAVTEVLRVEHLALALLVGSALVAARGLRLRGVYVFVFALAAGFGIHLGGIGITGEVPGPAVRVAWAAVVGAVTASTLGLVGGSVGLGLRRLSAGSRGGR